MKLTDIILQDLDPPMRVFFVLALCGAIFLFIKIGLDLVTDRWFNGPPGGRASKRSSPDAGCDAWRGATLGTGRRNY